MREVVEETKLIAACRRGDQASWQQLVERRQGQVYRLACRMLRDRAEAEDATQETFLRVYRRLETFRQGEPFVPWLLKIAYHLCLRRLQQRPLLPHDAAIEPIATLATPEDAAAQGENQRQLEHAISRLPPAYRAVITLRHLEGMEYQQIAQILDLPLGTVKTNLFRAHARLRETLQRGKVRDTVGGLDEQQRL